MVVPNGLIRKLVHRAVSGIAFCGCVLAAVPSATAEDVDPVALRQWLCTFFRSPNDAHPGLLSTAPVAFAQGSSLLHERRLIGTQGGFADSWKIGRRFSYWQTAYTRYGHEGRSRSDYKLEVNGDRGLVLADDASVRLFFKGFPEPVYADDTYVFRIIDPNDGDRGRFEITFDIRFQDMSLSWFRDEYQSYGLAFCDPL